MLAQGGGKGREVGGGDLKVHVEAVDGRGAEGAEDCRGGRVGTCGGGGIGGRCGKGGRGGRGPRCAGGGRRGAEHGPDGVGPGGGLNGGTKAAFGVSGAADGEEDGLAVDILACLDVFPVIGG